jgi:uncharacterized membrane protein
MDQSTSDIVIFFGRFHPMVLHLPIGLLFIASVIEVLSRFRRFKRYKPAVGLTLLLGAASAAVTAVLGYMLAQSGEYGEDLLFVHQWSGFAVVVISVMAFLLHQRSQTKTSSKLHKAYILAMCLTVIAVLAAGHFGGSLTHGSEYLTEYMPGTLRTLAGLPPKEQAEIKKITNLNEALVFKDIIYPILDARCTSCHNKSKSKGDLQMQTAEVLMKGGKNGPVFVGGNAQRSEMIKRLHLPENDDKHMPPDGKKQLTEGQVQLLAWWINEGASFDKTVSQLNTNEEMRAVLNTLLDPDVNKTEVQKLLASEVNPADEQALWRLQNEGVRITTLGGDVHWLQASISQSELGDSVMHHLSKVSEQLTWLDLAETSVSDKALSSVSEFKNLTRLYLENTKITDQGLQYLKDMPYLEYVNLYGTQVSDKGIQYLTGLKSLKKLYIWKTQVSKEGAATFQETLPGVEVNYGE